MSKPSAVSPLRFALYTLLLVAGAAGVIFAWHTVDQLLIADDRFRLSRPDDEESTLRIDGVKHASRDRIEALFREDLGRSVYSFPLTERRRNLLAVEWVKDATVSRVWPNQIAVRIQERRPVAFVTAQKEDTVATMIDDEGVLLPLRDAGRFKLPLVTGITAEQTEADRRMRIRRMLKMQSELGAHTDRLSEIDLSDPENVKITYPLPDRAMVLYIGHGHYAKRLRKFLENAEEIKRRLPEARVLDLRLDDRITAVPLHPPVSSAPGASSRAD